MTSSPSPILVTGAAGFLGSAAVGRLVADGHRVLALDTSFERGRVAAHPAVETVVGDVRDEARVGELVGRASRVLHLAAIAGVHHYLERADEVLDVNLLGTRAVVRAAERHGVPVLFASTSEAYGKATATLTEDGDSVLGATTNARWSYAVSKLAGEHYAWAWARRGGVVAAVRYFNVYGPALDAPGEGRVLAQFLGRLRDGRPLALVDGGHAVRCFCWIDDAVDATVRMLLALAPGHPLVGRPWNVGRDEPVTMRALAEQVVALAAHAPGVEEVPGAEFFGSGFEDIPTRTPDTSGLRRVLGWEAATPLRDGLRAVLAAHGHLRAPDATPAPAPIPVIRPVYDADEALVGRLRAALETGRTTNAGPEVVALEHEAARWLGLDAVLAVRSGAAGLEVAVRAVASERRGAAILPSFTYVSTLNAVELAGLEPVFCDVDPESWTMDPHHLAALLASRSDVGVVLPVCVFGVPPNLDAIVGRARAAGAAVVYDAAHAVGVEVDGHRAPRGPLTPDVTVWSLHATKVLPSTEGGLVAAADAGLRAELARLRTHGLAADPLDSTPGLNAKLDELAAATARHGLRHLHEVLARRRRYLARLGAALDAAGWRRQRVPPGVVPNGQNLAARPPRGVDAAAAVLDSHGVGWRRYFHPPLHRLRRFGGRFALPITDALADDLVNLPLHSRMSDDVLDRIEAAVRAVGEAP